MTKKAEHILTKISDKKTLALLDAVKGAREAVQASRIQRMVIPDEYKARDLIKARTKWMAARQDVKNHLFRDARN